MRELQRRNHSNAKSPTIPITVYRKLQVLICIPLRFIIDSTYVAEAGSHLPAVSNTVQVIVLPSLDPLPTCPTTLRRNTYPHTLIISEFVLNTKLRLSYLSQTFRYLALKERSLVIQVYMDFRGRYTKWKNGNGLSHLKKSLHKWTGREWRVMIQVQNF